MSRYFARDGSPMTLHEWAGAFEKPDAKRVAETTLPDGKWVSTVWLGLNHQFGVGPPLIFETMVFPSEDNMNELECERYSSEADARAGHDALVRKWAGESGAPATEPAQPAKPS